MANKEQKRMRRKLVENLVSTNLKKKTFEIADDELAFFQEYPQELDRLTSTAAAKRVYLIMAVVIGVVLVGLSIIIKATLTGEGGGILHGFITDLLFEGGVALWGASVTVFMLEILMQRQEIVNRHYRLQVLKRLKEEESDE